MRQGRPKQTPEDMPATTTAKLTKKFLMAQERGAHVVSNCYEMVSPGRHVTCFAEAVASPEDREAQWGRVKAAHADGRLCRIFRTVREYKKWQAAQGADGRENLG